MNQSCKSFVFYFDFEFYMLTRNLLVIQKVYMIYEGREGVIVKTLCLLISWHYSKVKRWEESENYKFECTYFLNGP